MEERTMWLQRNRGEAERGQSLTEFAISLTIIILIFSGVVDFGRAYFHYISLRDAAQEGAAYGSIAPTDLAGIRARVREASSGPIDFSSFSDSQIQVQVIGFACAGNLVQVTVESPFTFIAPFIAGQVLNLSAEATDTILQPPC